MELVFAVRDELLAQKRELYDEDEVVDQSGICFIDQKNTPSTTLKNMEKAVREKINRFRRDVKKMWKGA